MPIWKVQTRISWKIQRLGKEYQKRDGEGEGGGNLGGFNVVMLLSFISLILIYQQFSFMFSRPTSFITFLIVHILYGQDMTYNSGLEVSRRIAKIIFI